jgi:hypothetical protein
MAHRPKKTGWIRRFIGWLLGAPFRELPPEFGDAVPSELRVFEAQVEEAQHHSQGKVPATPAEHPVSPSK